MGPPEVQKYQGLDCDACQDKTNLHHYRKDFSIEKAIKHEVVMARTIIGFYKGWDVFLIINFAFNYYR